MGWVTVASPTGGIPVNIVKAFLSAAPIKYFIETGTQGGESIRAVRGLFIEAHTIEIIDGKEYGTCDERGNSESYHIGNSVNILPKIIEKFDDSWALFWLDAHYSGSVPNDTGYPECPLMGEIDAVSKYEKSVIIIDDARLFLGFSMWPLDNRQWPKIDDIILKLKMAWPQNFVTIVDDYILMIPEQFRDALDMEWRDNYSTRYPSENEVKKLAYRATYLDIMKNFDYLKTWMGV